MPGVCIMSTCLKTGKKKRKEKKKGLKKEVNMEGVYAWCVYNVHMF